MDHIYKHLATAATAGGYNPTIQAALTVGKKLLNKYYAATDHSEMYRIAMSMYSSCVLLIYKLIRCSLTSKSQARILQVCRLERGVARNSGQHSSKQVYAVICSLSGER